MITKFNFVKIVLIKRNVTLGDLEKCPYCGELMEEGYLISARGIYWNKRVPGWLCLGESIAPSAKMWQWKCPHLSAYQCRKCKIILVRYPEGYLEEKPPPTTEELYRMLREAYVMTYGSPSRLEDRIDTYMKEGLSREEAIRRVAEAEGYP